MATIKKPIPELGLYLYTQAANDIAESVGGSAIVAEKATADTGEEHMQSPLAARLTQDMAQAIRSGQLRSRNSLTGAPEPPAMDDPSPYVTVDDVNEWLGTARYPHQWHPDPLAPSPIGGKSLNAVANGLTKSEILAHDWPLQQRRFNQDSLERALGDIPDWLEHALVVRGKRGVASSTWNPSLLAECLHDRGYANQQALTRFLAANFPDWCEEWRKFTDSQNG